MQTLAQAQIGQPLVVQQVIGNDHVALRLMEMGITDGESIQVIGRAPMGDPLEVSIRGYKLSIRVAEAQRIEVVPSPIARQI